MFTGSIEWRGKNKDYARLIVSCGQDNQGRQIKKFKSLGQLGKREANKALAAFITEIEQGLYIEDKNMNFTQFIQYWRTHHAATKLKPKTRQRYIQLLESRIIPKLGHLKLNQMKPHHINVFLSDIAKEGTRKDRADGALDARTVHHHFSLLRSILNFAVRWEYMHSNPVTKVQAPKVEPKESLYYDQNQVDKLIGSLETYNLQQQTLIHLTLATGCRSGEIVGLTWDNVDFENNIITIKTTLQYVPGEGVIESSPKTKASLRSCEIPQPVIDLLRQHQSAKRILEEELGSQWIKSNYVFTNDLGQNLHPSTPASWFRALLKRHNLDPLKFHGLRHTSATLLLENGINVAVVSKRLGHSTIATTHNIYTHASRPADAMATKVMDQILSGKTSPKS